MNRGDEADGPNAKSDPVAPAAPGDVSRPATAEGAESSSHFAVVIFGDGSAAIDGESVPVVPGEPLDVAILDMLHGYARSRNASVTGAISDPSAGYVAIVEVAPDGSSKLLEQLQEEGSEAEGETGPAGPAEPARHQDSVEPAQQREPFEPFESGGPPVGTGSPDSGRQADETSEDVKPRTMSPGLQQGTSGAAAGKKPQPQSDDEYEHPGLLQRPLVVGGVAAGVAVLVISSLVALGSGSSGAQENRAAGSDDRASSSPMSLRPSSSAPAEPSPSDSTSPSVSPSKSPSKEPSRKPSKSPSAPALPEPSPPKPEPKESRKPGDDLLVPGSTVVLENQQYGFCADLPGLGKGRAGARVYDEHNCITSAKDNQLWTLHVALKGRGHDGSDLYVIRNAKDGFCLDLPGDGPAVGGTHLLENHCVGTSADNQLWWFEKSSGGMYRIRNHRSGNKCLDVARKDTKTKNANLTVYVCKDSDEQKWRLVRS
jgi:hypothetical protein